MITRPLFVAGVTTGPDARVLIPRQVEHLHAIADSTAAHVDSMGYRTAQYARQGAYAQGVADVLAWLNGAEPSTALTELLDG